MDAIESTGEVRISVHQKGINAVGGHRVLRFNPSGRLRAIEIDRSTERFWSGPFFPWRLGWWNGLAFEWPAFPLVLDAEPKRFEDYEGEIVQRVEDVEGGIRVTLERSGLYFDSEKIKTMEQVWEPGRPWWSSMSIRSQSEHEGVMHRGLEIESKLVRWSRMPTMED